MNQFRWNEVEAIRWPGCVHKKCCEKGLSKTVEGKRRREMPRLLEEHKQRVFDRVPSSLCSLCVAKSADANSEESQEDCWKVKDRGREITLEAECWIYRAPVCKWLEEPCLVQGVVQCLVNLRPWPLWNRCHWCQPRNFDPWGTSVRNLCVRCSVSLEPTSWIKGWSRKILSLGPRTSRTHLYPQIRNVDKPKTKTASPDTNCFLILKLNSSGHQYPSVSVSNGLLGHALRSQLHQILWDHSIFKFKSTKTTNHDLT